MPKTSRIAGALGLSLALCACSPVPTSGAGGTSVTSFTEWTRAIDADIDLLFVVDQSPSMASWQDKVAAQLPMLMDAAQCPHGDIPPSVREAVVYSPDGQLLTGLVSALVGFLRPDAYLGLVIITATDDASTPPVSDFVDRISSLVPNATDRVFFMGVVGPSSTRIAELANAFPNQARVSIDDDAYAPVLTPICTTWGPLVRPPCIPLNVQARSESGRTYPDCIVSERLQTVDGTQELDVPACAASAVAGPCWWTTTPEPASCGPQGGIPLMIENQPTGSDPAHYTVNVTMSCQLDVGAPDPAPPGSGG